MKEQLIFDLIEKRADNKEDVINKDFHFIKTREEADGSDNELIKSFRVYHAHGHCIDAKKESILNDEGVIIRFEYIISQNWDGFKFIEWDNLIKLLQNV